MARAKDWTGERIGKLVVVSRIDNDEQGRCVWLCRCDCGNEIKRRSAILSVSKKKGKISHCGCSSPLKTHGLSRGNRHLYWVWAAMVQRCDNPSNKDYPAYGGRGIKICREWREDFASFYEWAMNSGYRKCMTIERIDVDGNYCPENCSWVPNERQALNQRQSWIITHNGKTQHLSDWARECGIGYKTLRARIYHYGWDIERALSEKPKVGKNQHG